MMKYRLFGKSGLRVSQICLGTMTFGTEWGWGADWEESKNIFETYANEGGNFLDTANRYTEGTSEKYLADLISNDRDHFVLATKYSLKDRNGDPNFVGNHRKNMMRSVQDSLKRLKTDHIDLLWVHAWDFFTPEQEVMRGLDDLISRGLVHYIGISDTPAWVVAKCNTMADLMGWTAFTGLQVEYNLLQRTAERDLFPMAKSLQLTVTPWGPLAGGVLTGKYLKNDPGRIAETSVRRNEKNTLIVKELMSVAEAKVCTETQVALAWMMQHQPGCIPIVGARKAAHLKDSLGSVNQVLSADELERLNNISKIELGFPHDFLAADAIKDVLYGGTFDNTLH